MANKKAQDSATEQETAATEEGQEEEETTASRSRHIPKEVALRLLEDMRYRCCICRVLIDPHAFDTEAQFGSLEKHHLIQFSVGGENTYDNLLLVCANCHAQIHSHPEKYPIEELRERKRHWIEMKDHVPAELAMTGETENAIQVPFSVESVNLQYSILASPKATVAELTRFVLDKILRPLGEYDNNPSWLEASEIRLALRSTPKERLKSDLPLSGLQVAPGDILVSVIDVPVVPAIPLGRRDVERHPWEPELIFIPAGRFLMGSDKKRDPYTSDDELPQHWVYVGDFYIGKYSVTNAEYKRFLDATGHQMPDGFWRGGYPYDKANHPVVYVTWHDAVAYCKWLAESTGKAYRLPSEAEWEKAARGTDGWIYPWGDEWDPKRCNAGEGSRNDTTRVGEYSPQGDSPYGCADMAGNVWEWTRSLWRKNSELLSLCAPTDERENLDSGGEILRVVRGGAWGVNRNYARCAFGHAVNPRSQWHRRGFRVVVSTISP